MRTKQRDSPALAAYESTAPYYDELTAHHDYELWLGNMLEALPAQLRPGELLDVGCGTGKSFLPMLDRGWRATGVDISPAMLRAARDKVGAAVRLEVHDMRELPTLGQFDLVWSLDDALNYLLGPEDFTNGLRGLARNCRPGGLVIFDLNTLLTYRTFFAETHSFSARRGETLTWHGLAGEGFSRGSEALARFNVHAASGVLIASAAHRERHFETGFVERSIREAGLELLALYGHGLDAVFEQPLDEAVHTKGVFFCQPESQRR